MQVVTKALHARLDHPVALALIALPFLLGLALLVCAEIDALNADCTRLFLRAAMQSATRCQRSTRR